MLHLLTGQEPYEELLQDIRCPAYLKQELSAHWETSDVRSPYYVIGDNNDNNTSSNTTITHPPIPVFSLECTLSYHL